MLKKQKTPNVRWLTITKVYFSCRDTPTWPAAVLSCLILTPGFPGQQFLSGTLHRRKDTAGWTRHWPFASPRSNTHHFLLYVIGQSKSSLRATAKFMRWGHTSRSEGHHSGEPWILASSKWVNYRTGARKPRKIRNRVWVLSHPVVPSLPLCLWDYSGPSVPGSHLLVKATSFHCIIVL